MNNIKKKMLPEGYIFLLTNFARKNPVTTTTEERNWTMNITCFRDWKPQNSDQEITFSFSILEKLLYISLPQIY